MQDIEINEYLLSSLDHRLWYQVAHATWHTHLGEGIVHDEEMAVHATPAFDTL